MSCSNRRVGRVEKTRGKLIPASLEKEMMDTLMEVMSRRQSTVQVDAALEEQEAVCRDRGWNLVGSASPLLVPATGDASVPELRKVIKILTEIFRGLPPVQRAWFIEQWELRCAVGR